MTSVPPYLKSASLFLDFDSTIVQTEALDELAEIALRDSPERNQLLDSIRFITNAGMDGTMTIDESLRQRIAMLDIRAAMLPALIKRLQAKISPSMLRHAWLIQSMRDQIWVVSSGFHEWIDPVAEALGIRRDHVVANRLRADSGGILHLDPSSPCATAGSKAHAIFELGRAPPRIMVGDGMNDFEVRRNGQCEYFAAWIESVTRPNVVAGADIVAPHFEGLLASLQECLA